MESLRPSIFTYIALSAMGIPFLWSVTSSQSQAPLPLFSIFFFGYNPVLHFMYSPFITILTWFDYFVCVSLMTMPFEIAIHVSRSKKADQKAKTLNENDFQTTSEDEQFLLWLRPFSLDHRISIYSLPEIPNAVYVSFSDRTRSTPIVASEVNLYDMFRSFTKYDVIHVSEGENNLPGGGGIAYGDDEWQSKITLAIKNAKIIVFQPFDTPAMDFEFDLLKRLRGLDNILFFFTVFRTEHLEKKLFREKVKKVEHLRFYFANDGEKETEEVGQSILRFCEKHRIEHPDRLPVPALIRYHKNGEIDAICSLYLDRKLIRNFINGVFEVEDS